MPRAARADERRSADPCGGRARHAEHVTLYASANDYVLQVSHRLHKQLRAGETSAYPEGFPAIDTVDVSEICAGHGYVGQDGHVLGDIGRILRCCDPADTSLVLVHAPPCRLWRLREKKRS